MIENNNIRRKRKPWFAVLLILIFVILLVVYKAFGPNTGTMQQGQFLYIHTGATFDAVKRSLEDGDFISDAASFGMMAELADYPTHIHAGKYKIEQGMSNYTLIRLLRSGRQEPVKLAINKLRTKKDFFSLLGKNLETDSAHLVLLLNNDRFLSEFGLDTNTMMCAVMPYTYDFFWNNAADKVFRKIAKSYEQYWTEKRRKEAKDKNLSPQQLIILASVIDEESNNNEEKPNIASVYLNRLHKSMPLQADPTVRFACGDFGIRRITGALLSCYSPYNTYLVKGLPPGPICTPSVQSIEAVLQAPETKYLYFCAKADFSGHHIFAATYTEQIKNARLYQKALNERGIH